MESSYISRKHPWSSRVGPFLRNDGGLDHVPESSDGGVDVLWVDDLLLLVERQLYLPLLLRLLRRDADHGDPPVVRCVELGQVVQLRLRLG